MNAERQTKSKAAGADAYDRRAGERGAALATALILLVLMGVIAGSIVAVSTAEANVAGQDLQRMRTQKAAEAGLEHMTNKFSDLFQKTTSPSVAQLQTIAATPPPGLVGREGFTFSQDLRLDDARLAIYRARAGGSTSTWPVVVLPPGSNAYAGLFASLIPYKMRTTAKFTATSTEVTLEREINNYLIPLFQFGMFSDEDVEVHPGPPFIFNGRVHANGNVYVNGDVTFLNKVTTANELVTDVLRNGSTRAGANVRMQVGSTTVAITSGSVTSGPNFSGAQSGERGYFPGSPGGSASASWDTNSVLPAAAGVPNRFGGQLVTRSTGATPLKLPFQIGGHPSREIIKRRMPNDDSTLSEGRYHTKAKVRILLNDEGVYTDASGIPAGKGVELGAPATSTYYFKPLQLGGGKALWRINNDGSYADTTTSATLQAQSTALCPASTAQSADTVRGVKATHECSSNNRIIPRGAGIRGRVYVEVVKPDGTTVDVTRQILSLGMTVGEPNAVIMLQRPMWAAFTQGSRDRSGGALNQLASLSNSSALAADGEIKISSGIPQVDASGFLKQIQEDGTGQPSRLPTPVPYSIATTWTEPSAMWNSIVPINLYNVREGWVNATLPKTTYERGITQIVEINMRNLVRWLDGVYDSNLLAGTTAVSSNIDAPDGYVVYFSDRRGDTLRQERDPTGATLTTTNGMVDNEDIYGLAGTATPGSYTMNGTLDPGEDVIDSGTDMATGQPKKGTLQKDLCELPEPVQYTTVGVTTVTADRLRRAREVASWTNLIPASTACGNPVAPTAKYFRSAVRLFNGENLRTTGATGKLSATKGITFATENMLYVWGNYNTTGINSAPVAGSASVNDCTTASCYLGNQVPSSLVADAIFPLSKTWFDALPAIYPEGENLRFADANITGIADETSVRSGVIAGNNLAAMSGTPDAGNTVDSRLAGGMHNFPRFLENWAEQNRRWNLTGALIPLYRSTQAMGQWNYFGQYVIYGAPLRNWSFDTTFTDPAKLPPGTPTFQYIEPTGFRQVLSY